MTGIEPRALRFSLAALAVASAAAPVTASAGASAAAPAATATPWFALADLRQPRQAALLYAPRGPAPRTALSFIPLAPAEGKPQVACCVQVRGKAKPDTDSGAALLQADSEAPPLQRQAARLSKPVSGPVLALAIDGRRPVVDSTAAHTLLIHWPGRAEQLRVQHCVSAEGLHLRVTPVAAQGGPAAPVQHFYLPLGMEVEADCPADMMVPPAK